MICRTNIFNGRELTCDILFAALSTRMIDRIFSEVVAREGTENGKPIQGEKKMSYSEFVWFLLSEEDKNHPTAIEYWFR